MAVSGLIGAGAQDALAELFRQQLLKQQLEQRQREAEQEAALRQQQLTQQGEQNQFMRDWRTEEQAQSRAQMQAEAQQAAGQSARNSDMANVLQMPGLTDEQKRSELVGSMTRGGQMRPVDLLNLTAPKGPTAEDEAARELGLYEGKKRIDLKYARPAGSPSRPQQEWVVRNGQVTPIEEGTRQPGDLPYEKPTGGGRGDTMDTRIQEYTKSKLAEALETVKQLKGMAGAGTTGVMGLTKYLPGAPARDVNNVLNQLKGQLAFKELAAMRAASPTGGALGQVSERELDLLSSSQGGLDQLAANFPSELSKIEASLTRALSSLPVGGSSGISAASPPSASGGVQVTAPNGKTYTFADEASAAIFRKAVGGQ